MYPLIRALTLVLVFGLVALGGAGPVRADSSWWFFHDRPYFEPVVADPRAALVKVLFPAFSKSFPFAQHPGDFRLVWDISVGKEIPIFGYDSGMSKAGPLSPGTFGWGFWFPIGFHLIEDLVKDDSSPPVDTDYRFAPLAFKAQYAFDQQAGQGAWRVGLRVFGGHESTHLGDEFTLHARRLYPDFKRINVSYQWLDLTLGLERDPGASAMTAPAAWKWKLQGGVTTVVFSGKDESYYSTDPFETNGVNVLPSHNRTEPYLSLEVERVPVVLSGSTLSWFGAVDARLRNVYDYGKTDASKAEARQPSVNGMIGVRAAVPDRTFPDFYVRGYYGVNPAGQFRDQRDYWLFGLGLLFHT